MRASAFPFVTELAAAEGVRLRIRGNCMTPHLVEGAEVTVTAQTSYLPGDVVVFRTPAGELAAHRVVGWRPAGLVTKGDGCVLHDAPVPTGAIVGRVERRVAFRTRLRALATFAGILLRRAAR